MTERFGCFNRRDARKNAKDAEIQQDSFQAIRSFSLPYSLRTLGLIVPDLPMDCQYRHRAVKGHGVGGAECKQVMENGMFLRFHNHHVDFVMVDEIQ